MKSEPNRKPAATPISARRLGEWIHRLRTAEEEDGFRESLVREIRAEVARRAAGMPLRATRQAQDIVLALLAGVPDAIEPESREPADPIPESSRREPKVLMPCPACGRIIRLLPLSPDSGDDARTRDAPSETVPDRNAPVAAFSGKSENRRSSTNRGPGNDRASLEETKTKHDSRERGPKKKRRRKEP
jgi:hypothetical protein